MKSRLLVALTAVLLFAQAHSDAANPRHKRPTSKPLSAATQVHQSAANDAPADSSTAQQPQPSASPGDGVPTITIAGGNDPAEARYEQAKARAKDDPEVKPLKARADQAATEDEARRASVAYNKALFRKVREIDREAADRASAVEFAIIRRINQ